MDDDLRRREGASRRALVEFTSLLHLLVDFHSEDMAAHPVEAGAFMRALGILGDMLAEAHADIANPDFRKTHEAKMRRALQRAQVEAEDFLDAALGPVA